MAENLATILSPAEAVAEEWAQRVRASNPLRETDGQVFVAVAEALVRHLDDGEPVRCPEVGELSVSTLTVLRQVGHDRVTSSAEAEDAAGLLSRFDGAVDAMLLDCVEGQMRGLELDAFADPLTGAGNRRALERDLRVFLAQVERYDHPLSIVMIDLDGLKAVNDVQGHEAGDALLRQLSMTFVDELRAGDAFYRVGGDEFVAVLPHADRQSAEAFVERVRAVAPAFSAGVATAPLDGIAVGELIDVADQRLIRHRGPSRARRARAAATPSVPRQEVGADAFVVASVTTTVDWERTTIEVLVRQGDMERTGKSSGSTLASAAPSIAASATIDAFRRLGHDLVGAVVESAELRAMADREVVTVIVSTRAGDMELTGTGSAIVRRGVGEAAAVAVIQALGRSLPARQVIQV